MGMRKRVASRQLAHVGQATEVRGRDPRCALGLVSGLSAALKKTDHIAATTEQVIVFEPVGQCP
jgi:hypothetical protein